MENIILIGMPGCGKSTVGATLSQMTRKEFIDADAYLESVSQRKIPEIIATDGEKGFRALESQVLQELGKKSGIILATGGGCVTQEENYASLHQNGTLFYISRDLSLLPTDGRPLSQATNLTKMYQIRKPLYEKFADYSVDNCESAGHTAQQILDIWEADI